MSRWVRADALVGIAEIAELAGVSSAAVVNWRNRFDDFPEPLATLRSGPIFDREPVVDWLLRTRRFAR